jgi:hypothetical protein
MSKISTIVKVRGGYANYVQLRNALREDAENTERMAMYRPTKGHRTALERISRGLFTPNDKKFYLLSGSYGTGKSHLCLMLANLLGKSSDDPSLKGFYDNYAKLDQDRAKNLKNVRQGGQYLVALCDYGSGQKFEDAVLKAIVEACAERGISTDKQTEFDEAERLLTEWENSKGTVRDFMGDFTKALASVSPGTPVAALRTGLKNYDRAMMDKFHAAYSAAQGVPFQSKAGNLVAIVKKLVASKEFTAKFKGLAIFFDEFGTAVLQNSKFDPAVMQAFMEEVCQQLNNVVFVGCIHKRFQDYAERTNQATASVMSARLTQVDLLNEGIEEIIGAIVETEKASAEWKNEVLPKAGIFDQLTPQCLTLKLFPWITDTSRIRERVLEDIYGMHPMALHCLLKLSSEIGSDARSTFTFFSGGTVTERGSYAEFIEKSDITGPNGALRLYQTAQLFEFFEKELAPASRELLDSQRALVNGYVASLQALKKSVIAELFDEQQDERVALLRMVLIFSLCGQPTTLDNLQFGRYCTNAAEKATVKRLLGELATAGAIYLRKPSNTYELCATEGQDPFTLVESFANLPETDDKATVEELLKQTGQGEEYLNANGWNLIFGEDKRLKRKFVRGRELGTDLWAKLEQEAATAGAKFSTSFEGHAVYALCEDEAEVKLARDAVKTIPAGTILVAVPHDPTPFREDLKKVLACRHYLAPEEAGKHPAQTTARIQDMWDGDDDSYLPQLKKIVTATESGSQATWYAEAGKLLVEKPTQSHQPADMLCGQLFSERCQIKHPDLNVVHDEKWQKSQSLKQAVAELLDPTSPVQIDNGNPENHGEKRYLQKVLLQCGALRPLPGSEGPLKAFAAESDATKLDAKFPVLKKLCERLNALKAGEALGLANFAKEMRGAPVGASGTMLVLALAHVVRAFGERLRVFRDSTRSDIADVTSYEAIVAAITDRSSKIELAVREISAPQRQFIEAVAKAVDAPPLAAGETRSVTSACEAVRDWWRKLPAVAKIATLHPVDSRTRLEELRQTLGDGQTEPFDLMLSRLPAVYAGEPVDAIKAKEAKDWAEAFATDVKRLNGGLALAKRQLAEAILSVHGGAGDMLVCETAVNTWFASLTPDQRDVMRCDDEDAQRLLTVLNDSSKLFEVKLIQTLANQWGFGAVTDWTSLHTDAYKAKWELAKKAIEEVQPLVPEPTAEPDELTTVIKPKVWEVEDGAKIRIQIPAGATSVVYTLGDENAAAAAERITIQEDSAITVDLKGKAVGELQITALDSVGNASRPVNYRFRHKQKQHEVTVEQEDLLGEKGIFKFPDTLSSFIAVLKSITAKALERKIISSEAAEQIKTALDNIKKS